MPRFFGKTARKRQPQALARIRPAHPLAFGLVGYFSPSTATAQRVGDATLNGGVDGLGFYSPSFGTYWQASATSLVSQYATWTILAVVNGTQSFSGSNGVTLYAERPNGTQIVKLQMSFGGGSSSGLTVRDLSSNLVNFSGSTDTCTGPGSRVIIGTRRASNNHRLYVNGVLEGSDTTNNVNGSFGASDAQIGQDPQDSTTSITTASAPLILLWNRSLSDAEIAAISANPWQVFATPQRLQSVPLLSAGVSAALTGVTGTGAAGTVGPQTAAALTGNAGTGSVGTLGPQTAKGITNNAATGAVGVVAPGAAKALTGNAGTGAAGTSTPSTTIGLAGSPATGAVGTVSASSGVTVALTGVAGTGAAGTLGPASSKALTGAAGTGTVGTIAGVSVTVALSGVLASGAAGSVAVPGATTTTGPGFEIGPAPRRSIPERNFVPILQRVLAARAAKVKPVGERQQKRAKAIEEQAAAGLIDGTADEAAMRLAAARWMAQLPVLTVPQVDPYEVFLAQVLFRLKQAHALAQQQAIEDAARRKRQDEDAVLALLLS